MTTLTDHDAGRFGTAVFATQDGLTAEGDGHLSYISDNVSIIELRGEVHGLPHLPPLDQFAIFMNPVEADGERMMLLGLAERSLDAMGRDGFIGNCVLIEETDLRLADHIRRLTPHFEQWSDFYQDIFRKQRHVGNIGYLNPETDAPEKLKRPTQSTEIRAFSMPQDGTWLDGVMLLRRVSLASDDNAASVIFWPKHTNLHPALTQDLVSDIEQERAHREAIRKARRDHENELKRREQEAEEVRRAQQHVQYRGTREVSDDRLDKFHRRTEYLRPRPPNIDVEYEDYLLSLIEFTLNQSRQNDQRRDVAQVRLAEPPASFGLNTLLASNEEPIFRIPELRLGMSSTTISLVVAIISLILLLIIVMLWLFKGDVGQNFDVLEKEQTSNSNNY